MPRNGCALKIENGAQGGVRTRMPYGARDFKSLVSTNSTTRAKRNYFLAAFFFALARAFRSRSQARHLDFPVVGEVQMFSSIQGCPLLQWVFSLGLVDFRARGLDCAGF